MINSLPFSNFTKGFEYFEGFLNKILFSKIIKEFGFVNWDVCIHPLFFLKSIILLKFSFLSIISIGRYFFLYTYFIG